MHGESLLLTVVLADFQLENHLKKLIKPAKISFCKYIKTSACGKMVVTKRTIKQHAGGFYHV